MNAGFRKSAIVAYLALCIYLLAQPSPHNLSERAETLDKQFAAQGRATLSSALASALQMPVAKVDIYLSLPDTRPSDLVFAKLLDQCGARATTETPAQTVIESGMPAREAIAYFDKVDRLVAQNLAHEEKVEVIPNPSRVATPRSLVHSLKSRFN